jgi:diguanylate cyclase (GGDEF)-like protein
MTKYNVNVLFISQGKEDDLLIKPLMARKPDSGFSITHHNGCEELSTIPETHRYDAVLISAAHYFKKTLACLRWFNAQFEELPVLIITDEENPNLYPILLQAGAADCIPQDQLIPEILERCLQYVIRQKHDEGRLLQLAHFDPLTGTANQQHFQEKLTEYIAHSRRANHTLAVLLINLDGFRTVNHRMGHAEGDLLLIKTSERLQNSIRETDTLARLKADQFAIAATQLHSPEEAGIIAKAILETCQFTIKDDYDGLHITCSVGIALFPNDNDSAQQLLSKAEEALSRAKQQGRACFHYADNNVTQSNQQQQQLIEQLGSALLRKQFNLLYQPIVAASDERVCRVEAFLRWNHPHHGMLLPDHFLPLAKRCGLIQSIGSWVLNTACEQQLEWQRQGLPSVPLAINLSAPEFSHRKLLHHIYNLPKSIAFDLSQLHLEINESDLINTGHEVCAQLCELHDLGVHLTVDNFGKDQCSLKQLNRLPVDCVKIDPGVTERIPYDNEDLRVTEAIIQLSKIMNIDVVAQGVEDPLTIPSLLEKECTMLQGYAIGEPMTGEQFPIWHGHYSQQTFQTALH